MIQVEIPALTPDTVRTLRAALSFMEKSKLVDSDREHVLRAQRELDDYYSMNGYPLSEDY